jgi:hypothetical protein
MHLPRTKQRAQRTHKQGNHRKRFHRNRMMIAQMMNSSRNWQRMTMMMIWQSSLKDLLVQRKPKAINPTRAISRSKATPDSLLFSIFLDDLPPLLYLAVIPLVQWQRSTALMRKVSHFSSVPLRG